jgi:hypothetical protein
VTIPLGRSVIGQPVRVQANVSIAIIAAAEPMASPSAGYVR